MCWTHWYQGWALLHSPEPQAGVDASDNSSDIIRVLIMVDSWRGRRRNKGGQLWLGALDLAQLDLHVMLSLVRAMAQVGSHTAAVMQTSHSSTLLMECQYAPPTMQDQQDPSDLPSEPAQHQCALCPHAEARRCLRTLSSNCLQVLAA